MQRRAILLTAMTSALAVAGSSTLAEARHRPGTSGEVTAARDWAETPRSGPLTLVVSIPRQRLTVYDGTTVVATTPVSTGVPGHRTPTGVFTVIQKQRYHRSNIYSDAPMPYMQRITWSGVALHEGHVTGRPASHGCIRLPHAFAIALWKATRVGARVIVSEQEVVPLETDAPEALVPAPKPMAAVSPPAPAPTPIAASGDQVPQPAKTVLASADVMPSLSSAVQNDAAASPAPTPAASAVEPKATGDVAPSPAVAPPGEATPDAPAPVLTEAPPAPKPFAIDKAAGPISVFFSRKEGKVFVRQNFAPIYQAAATFDPAPVPLGTHVFTLRPSPAGEPRRWLVASIATLPMMEEPVDDIMIDPVLLPRRGRHAIFQPAASSPAASAAAREALARVHLSDESRDIIAAGIGPGASIIVSDLGLGSETGKGTEFIVQSR